MFGSVQRLFFFVRDGSDSTDGVEAVFLTIAL